MHSLLRYSAVLVFWKYWLLTFTAPCFIATLLPFPESAVFSPKVDYLRVILGQKIFAKTLANVLLIRLFLS